MLLKKETIVASYFLRNQILMFEQPQKQNIILNYLPPILNDQL